MYITYNKIKFFGTKFFATKKLQFHETSTTNPIQLFDIQKEEALLTKKQLAQKLNCSVSYINKLMAKKIIVPIKNGNFVRFLLSEVLTALRKWSQL